MKSRRLDRPFLRAIVGVAIMLIPCMILTSCVEEQQLEELVQETNQEETMQEPAEPEEPAVALPGLPEDVAGYERWLKLNAEPIPPVEGFDPHNGDKNVYVNQTRDTIAPDGEQQFPYPDGSVVVKEAYRPNKDYVGLIAIMRKIAGSDPDHNDWEFIEYTRNDPDADFKVIASGRICWGCHARVEDIDYVFTELE
ncbi:MAG: cytochrome P460 family protein [Candidatus Poribacteria bacterium]|nr:cytochrome P460 family protein [Candidatus Poribacteria bacterium]